MLFFYLLNETLLLLLVRGVTIHFFHKQYISRYLICITIRITIRFIGNCNYSLKSMLVDMSAAMFFFLYEVAFVNEHHIVCIVSGLHVM